MSQQNQQILLLKRVFRQVRRWGAILQEVRKFPGLARVMLCLAVFSLLSPAALQAQTGDETSAGQGLRGFYISGAPVFQLGSPVNGGGTVSVNSVDLSGGFKYQFNEKFGAGLALLYNLSDFRFSGVNAIPLSAPWGTLQRYGVAVPLVYTLADDWHLIGIPLGQFSGENGAKWGSSLVYGGLGGVMYNWGLANFIGVGVGAFYNIAETDVFPYLALNWRLNDRWRLSNPALSSPAGPAGLMLSYGLTPHWEIGLAGSYRYNRFRLDKNGPLPNGVGQYSQWPLVASIRYSYSLLCVTAYGGVAFDNKIWMENSNGSGIYRADQKPAPLVGMSLSFGVQPTQFRAEPWQIYGLKGL
jgi:hypothetical protein